MEKEIEKLKNKNLVLFFTYGVSLKLWDKKGMLSRELKLYKELSKNFGKIYFITYGRNDEKYQEELKKYNIQILFKKNNLPNFIYSIFVPFFYHKELKQADFYKTNQMLGSWSAVFAKWFFGKKLIVRTGYTLSLFSKRVSKLKYIVSKLIEWFALKFSDVFIVATEEEKEYFKKFKNKIKVIPNYVDTELFRPMSELKNKEAKVVLIFIGRLTKQKNLENLFLALENLDNTRLQIIGSGELEKELRQIVQDKKLDVEFLGDKLHEELPKYINYADMFVLPSLYEGNPKVLLEAMACGSIILSTKSEGVKNLVDHMQDGYLVGTSSEDLQEGIKNVLNSESLQNLFIKNALEKVQKKHSLGRIIKLELENYD